jgi:hypothetical protein
MKKLLLTLTSLALLSTSLYAGCTADVDMGGNKITDLGAPTTGTDAVNRDYVDNKITGSSVAINIAKLNTDTQITGAGDGVQPTLHKSGNIVCFSGGFRANATLAADTDLTSTSLIPVGYRPPSHIDLSLFGLNVDGTSIGHIRITSNGTFIFRSPIAFANQKWISVAGCWYAAN